MAVKRKSPHRRTQKFIIAEELQFRGVLHATVDALPFGKGWRVTSPQLTGTYVLRRRGSTWYVIVGDCQPTKCINLQVAVGLVAAG